MSSQEQLDQDEVVVEVFPGIEFTNAREARGLELNEVATTLNISASYLIAIEEGRLNALPNRVFAIGYLKGYARHLGLDEDQVVSDYERFTGSASASDNVKPLKTVSGNFDAPKRKGGGMLAITTVLLLGVVAGAGYWWQNQQGAGSETEATVASLPASGEPVSLSAVLQREGDNPVVDGAGDASEDGANANTGVDGDGEPSIPPTDIVPEPVVEAAEAEVVIDTVNGVSVSSGEPASSIAEVSDTANSSAAVSVQAGEEQVAEARDQVDEPEAEPSQNVVIVQEPPQSASEVSGDDGNATAPESNAVANVPAVLEAPALASGEGHLRIVFSADCWVEVRDGNGKMLVASVRNAQRGVDVKGAYPFKVTLGALSSVASLSYNGKDVELVKRGRSNVLRLTLPQAE